MPSSPSVQLPNPPNYIPYPEPYRAQPQLPQRIEHYFDNPFGTAFKMTVGVLVAVTVWSVFWMLIWITFISALISSAGQQ